ncbi:MAG: hypothetical protein R3F41_13410 [Gammaproteobacteria bacterium]
MSQKNIVKSCQVLHRFEGLAFGLDQPTILCELRIFNFTEEELLGFENLVSRLLDDPGTRTSLGGQNLVERLVKRLHFWSSRLQQQLNIPVFDSCTVVQIELDSKGEDFWRCRFAFPYAISETSIKALDWIFAVCNASVEYSQSNSQEILEQLAKKLVLLRKALDYYSNFGTNTIHLQRAAHELDIPRHTLAAKNCCYGLGKNSRWFVSTVTDQTSGMGVMLAGNKLATAKVLAKHLLPVPDHRLVCDEKDAIKVASRMGYPVVVKPADKDQGEGVFAGLNSEESFLKAYRAASEVSNRILVERHYAGQDYRITVLHGRVIKIMVRTPGRIIGNGKQSVADLVKVEQSREQYQSALRRTGKMRLQLDDEALGLLEERGLNTESVPEEGQIVLLRRKSNISTGGIHNVIPIDNVHKDNCELAIRVATILGLDIAGIDLILKDIKHSWRETNGVILEVNAQPQIGFSQTPEIFKEILQHAVPEDGKIPLHLGLINHKTLAEFAPQCNRLAQQLGCNGYSTADGFWIKGEQRGWKPPSAFHSGQGILLDRELESGLILMSPREILQFGLPARQFSTFSVLEAPPLFLDNEVVRQAIEFVKYHCDLSPTIIDVDSLEAINQLI